MSLTVDGKLVVVRARGDGLVSIDGLGSDRRRPAHVLAALHSLAEQGVFDPDDDSDRDYTSGGWDAGDVAAAVAPWYDLGGSGGVEFTVDDIEMCSDGHGRADPTSPTEAEALTLARDSWGLEGGGGSPGNDDSGEVVLLRIGPHYVVYQCAGGDVIADEDLATSDDDARAHVSEGFRPEGD